jgi:tRNA U34 5-methylaminomethyl-2-thiouridine-forming methyltransferase MnmC
MSNQVELKLTSDGSHTLFVPALNENYHSYHGAYAEAQHVFIKMGLIAAKENFSPINVFEVGFGTGLNATLAYQFCIQQAHPVNYTGIEKHPLPNEIISQLNYGEFWKDAHLDEIFTTMHGKEWDRFFSFTPDFKFRKLLGSVLDFAFEPNHYQVIFFDAFAPEKQPEMWTVDLFTQLYQALAPGGMLVTYCAKGQFKRDLKAAGFEVQTLAGPPGKREMVRGIKGTF